MRLKYKTAIYRDCVHVEYPLEDNAFCDLFFFSYGSLVCWNANKEQGYQFLEMATIFEQEHGEEIETDEFTYVQGETSKIFDDEITLPNFDTLTKLAVSHGIAQSVKLGTFEIAIQKIFNHTKQIPEDLAKLGSISLSRRQIRRQMGELFLKRSTINLHLDVLDTPEFFWYYPELEPYYHLIANYLDVKTRVEVLNQRLDVIHELFNMLGNELNHQHSSRLEWTVIGLIVIEVVLSLLRDVFQLI